jgi:hypothetical protein
MASFPRRGCLLLLTTTMLCPFTIAAQVRSPAKAAASSAPSLEEQFRDPPASARPRVWWHWMNGNVTKDGIAKDLAWMKRVGIGGLQSFDAGLATPQIVKDRLIFMHPAWKDAFRFAASEAERLGLEMAIASSPGWSETGGPWVTPQDGMKKVVWVETDVAGGKPVAGRLAAPPSVSGPFQSLAKPSLGAALTGDKEPATPTFYRDIAVLAYPAAPTSPPPVPVVRSDSGKTLNGAALADGDLQTTLELNRPASGRISLIFDYGQSQTMRSANMFAPGAAGLFSRSNYATSLEASDDGRIWRRVADLGLASVPTTTAFAPVTARQFRVTFTHRPSGGNPALQVKTPGVDPAGLAAFGGVGGGEEPSSLRIGELRLSSEDRIDHFEAKAGFDVERDYFELSRDISVGAGVAPARVVDLTPLLRSDGTLNWTPPAGHWRLLRIGYSLVGTTNHPASPEATGLEVDKFDGSAVRRYLGHYLDLYRNAAGAALFGKRGVRTILTDSIEVGAANWTPRMVAQFKRLRGYDPTPWLPALTGAIIGSRADSDKFLYDYRRTLADLIASEHYGTIAKVAHENGLKVYGEALEGGRPSLGDDMSMRRYADIPMAAMWTHSREEGPSSAHMADIKGAASVAHIYGQNIVAAEALTSSLAYWDHAPAYLKRIIDLAFVTGINRPVIHTSVHQPVDDKVPGLSLSIFGQFFNRHESWAELARPWVDYIARNSLMLQQGRNVADVGYFYGEEAPLTGLYRDKNVADAPRVYGYDFVNAETLHGALANEGGDLVTPGGARYRALFLGGSSRMMTLATLRKLAALVQGGATLVGMKPAADPSRLSDAGEYAVLAARLWTGEESTRVGKGMVIASDDVESALVRVGLRPDFRFTGAKDGASIPFLHRSLVDGESYFLVNQQDRAETIEAHFRVTGKAPELWHAETGATEAVSYRIENGETIVPLTLAADESVHVVFRKAATRSALSIKKLEPTELARIEGQWKVAFQAGRGAPAMTTMAKLAPLNDNAEPGIRYFSGIATYSNTLSSPHGWRPGQPLWLDLGEAREVAEVMINGKPVGYAWHAPYRVEIGSAMRRGSNAIEIRVANLWVNRLIGDAQPGARKITWTALPTYKPDAPLRRSGLIGPVRLLGQH